MGLISFTEVTDGNTANAADLNTPLNTIYDEVNGNLQAVNLADDAVTTAKLADSSVTADKRTGGFKVGVITTTNLTSTGSKAITGVGFEPSFIEVHVNLDTSAAGASRSSVGVSDGTTTRSMGTAVDGSGGASARYNSTALINARNEANVSQVTATFTSLDSDGFTFNVTLANSSYSGFYVAYR